MKSKTAFFVVYFFLSFFYNLYAKETVITGKIIGALPDAIRFSAPVNGNSGFDYYYTTKADANGSFTMTINLEDMTIIDIFYDYKPACSVIARPGEKYTLAITQLDDKIEGIVAGRDTEGQKLYNSISHNHRMSLIAQPANDIATAESAEDLEHVIRRHEAEDIEGFKNLQTTGKISRDFLNTITIERNYLYAAMTAYQVLVRHAKSERGGEAANLSDFDRLWGSLYKKYPINNKSILKSPFAFYFLDSYCNFKLYEEVVFKPVKRSDKGLAFKPKKMAAWLQEPNLEYYTAAYLHSYLIEGVKDEILINVFDDFEKQYPKSGYLKYLKQEMAPLLQFHKIAIDKSLIVEGYQTINSLEELITKFPGQKIYLDIWATWCGPCREEFKYKNELYKLLKAEGITPVYISIDEDRKDKAWKKMINYYKLEGHHLRTNKQLDGYLRKLFDKNGTISIPWYILISKDGKINNLHAHAMSDLEELKKEIRSL